MKNIAKISIGNQMERFGPEENFWKKGPPLNPDLSGSFSLPIGPVDPKGAVRFGQPDVLPSAFH